MKTNILQLVNTRRKIDQFDRMSVFLVALLPLRYVICPVCWSPLEEISALLYYQQGHIMLSSYWVSQGIAFEFAIPWCLMVGSIAVLMMETEPQGPMV